jgi:hypothetical protein
MTRSSSLPHLQAAKLESSELVGLRRQGNWSVTMKWSDRIARGFNPGWGGEERAPPVRRSFGDTGAKEEKWHPIFGRG